MEEIVDMQAFKNERANSPQRKLLLWLKKVHLFSSFKVYILKDQGHLHEFVITLLIKC